MMARSGANREKQREKVIFLLLELEFSDVMICTVEVNVFSKYMFEKMFRVKQKQRFEKKKELNA